MCTVAPNVFSDIALTLAGKAKATKQKLITEWPFPDFIL